VANPRHDFMDRKKKARLESAGWAVGSANDFLGLSEAESARIERMGGRPHVRPSGRHNAQSSSSDRTMRCRD
jgi:hypothetical protein